MILACHPEAGAAGTATMGRALTSQAVFRYRDT